MKKFDNVIIRIPIMHSCYFLFQQQVFEDL